MRKLRVLDWRMQVLHIKINCGRYLLYDGQVLISHDTKMETANDHEPLLEKYWSQVQWPDKGGMLKEALE